MGETQGIPRFMIDRSIMFCSPVTVYTAKRDGTFVARCHSIPGGLEVHAETFDGCVAAAMAAYLAFCRKGIWN